MVLPTNKQKDKIDINKMSQIKVTKTLKKNNKRWLNKEETLLTFSNHSQRRRQGMIEPQREKERESERAEDAEGDD